MSDYSFEIFPPKTDADFAKVHDLLKRLDDLSPSLISVTYGAGGSNSKKTLELVQYIKENLTAEALAHITCVGFSREELDAVLDELWDMGCRKLLALRGDRPAWMSDEQFTKMDFSHASDMIAHILSRHAFQVAAACYPEKHPEASSEEEDLKHLKEKADAGADLLISQMFFDNAIFYRFLEKTEKAGIDVPIEAGIMPITSAKQLGTSITLSGSSIPKALSDLIAAHGHDPEEMRKAGLDYAAKQILDLQAHGISGVHLYSMNRSKSMEELIHALYPGH